MPELQTLALILFILALLVIAASSVYADYRGGLLAMMRFVESEKVAGLSYSLIFLSVTAAITQIWHLNAVSKWAARQ